MTEEPSTEATTEGSTERSIELAVEVAGTVEEVWRAIATGPGISSWYVPHEIEEAEGGAASASFGPGMDVAGQVTAWDPPNRFAYAGTEEGPGLAFEWFVEAKDGGSCIVRLVNSGFGLGGEWDDHYDAMTEGWKMFMANLQLHCEHFAGQSGVASLPMGMWAEEPAAAWDRAASAFGFNPSPAVGDRIEIAADGAPPVVATVHEAAPTRITFITTEPTPGTGFVTAEGQGGMTSFSIWLYLYGDEAAGASAAHRAGWMAALERVGPPADGPQFTE